MSTERWSFTAEPIEEALMEPPVGPGAEATVEPPAGPKLSTGQWSFRVVPQLVGPRGRGLDG